MKMTAFFGPNIAREGGGEWGGGEDRMNPKPIKKMSLVAEYLEGLFHTVPSCFVLHCGLLSAVFRLYPFIHLNLFVLRMDRVSQRINHYPLDKYW